MPFLCQVEYICALSKHPLSLMGSTGYSHCSHFAHVTVRVRASTCIIAGFTLFCSTPGLAIYGGAGLSSSVEARRVAGDPLEAVVELFGGYVS